MSFISKIKQGLLHMAAVVLVVTAVALPQSVSAATSGNATIHNAVTVSYTSGVNVLTAFATVDVTVTTLAAAPTITVPTATTTVAGGVVNLVYTVRSNANGTDTYTPTAPTTTDANVSASTVALTGSPLTLWGGIVTGSGAGTISIPAGSEAGLTAGTTTVELTVGGAAQRYTVTTITAGSIATTNITTGVTTPETNTVLALTPIGGAPAITAANVAVGTQVGEYNTFTVDVTAGTPTTPGTDGTHTVPSFNITTTATDAVGAPIVALTGATVTVTVSSPSLSITKKSRNVTAGGAFATTGTTAKPGEVLEYEIVVTNTHATAQATGVSISDALPVYTTLLPATTINITSTLGGVVQPVVNATQAAGDDVATVAAGTLTVNLGTGATAATAGTLAAGDTVTILYQVTVQ